MTDDAYVYILANRPHGTLYVGVTNDLHRRMHEHRSHLVRGFTEKYGVTRLVWFAVNESITEAITAEKKIKNRGRLWKIELIERDNPDWSDLSVDWE